MSNVVSQRLRDAVNSMDSEINRLPTATAADTNASRDLRIAWLVLVDCLALGEAPALRECPKCKHYVMAAATRCGYCWISLIPMARQA